MNIPTITYKKREDHVRLAQQLLMFILGTYVFIMAEEHRLYKIPVLFFGLLIWVFFQNKTKHPILWIVFFSLLILDLFNSYFWVANHHFMLLLMVLAVINFQYHKSISILTKNIQLLVVVVVMTSALQKLFSNQFISGDFYYFMANDGVLFNSFLNFFPDTLELVNYNSEIIEDLNKTDPNVGGSIALKDIIPNLPGISLGYAWFTFIFEFIVAIAIWFKPYNIKTHIILLALIIGILVTRLETGFMALLAVSGFFLCRHELKLKLLYIVIVIGCLTLIITKRGFH